MEDFKYVYISNETGKREKGVIQAKDMDDAKRRLAEYVVIEIKKGSSFLSNFSKKNPTKYHKYYKDIMHKFGFMLNRNLNLMKILDIMADKYEDKDKAVSKAFKTIKTRMSDGGITLSSAMAEQSEIFDIMVISSVEVGEETGKLDQMFMKLADFYAKKIKLKKKIKKSMMQPGITLGLVVAAFTFVVTSILPKLLGIFSDVGAEIPASTQAMLDISDFITNNFLIVILGIFGIIFGYKKIMENKKILYKKDKFTTKIPVLGNYQKNINLAIITSNLAILLKSGVDLRDSLKLIIKITKNTYYKNILIEVNESIGLGNGISLSLSEHPELFDKTFIAIVKAGEETGGLDETLEVTSEEYFEVVDEMSETVTTVLNFVVLLAITGVVGVLVSAIYGPIQGLSEGLMGM